MVNELLLFLCFLCSSIISHTSLFEQLRGRVGRADMEAHAHLFYPDKSLLSNQARVWSYIYIYTH